MATIDVQNLLAELEAAARGVLGADLAALRQFSAQQLEALARQGVLIAAGVADGSIDAALRAGLLQELGEMTRSFVNTVAGLLLLLAERLWNALIAVLWGAIGAASGVPLPLPSWRAR
jgi:hypothetical protein